MKKRNFVGKFILSFLIMTQNGLFAQNADDKKLQIITLPGYQYPTAINPSLQTVPAQQLSGVLTSDATDIRVYPSSNHQSEIHASISKANPQNILISAQTYFGTSIQGYYYSNDGGITWAGADQLPNNVVGRGDPATAFDYDGNGYLVSMAATSSTSDPDGYFIQKTLNGGTSWQTQKRGVTDIGFDKEMVSVDNLESSPYKNYFYCAWTDFDLDNDQDNYETDFAVKFNRSTDGGASFSTPIILKSGWGQGTNVQSGPNGEVYVCWANYGTGTYPANGIGFSKSLDGGVTFVTTIPIAYTGIRVPGTNPLFNNTRVNDFPAMAVDKSTGPYRGRIYIAYPEKENGNGKAIIRLRYSNDRGITWSAPLTVSISNGTQSWFPWITVDEMTGDLSIIYYSFDDVNSSFSTNTYVAHSSDGGASFENIKVSDVSHITAPIPGFGGGYAGDYIGICAYGNKVYPTWADNRNGTWQVYVSPLTYGYTITVSQKNTYGNSVGIVSRWNGSSFSGITLELPYSVPMGSTEILKGEQTIISNEKYNIWKNNGIIESSVKNHHEFFIDQDKSFTSQLIGITSASLKTTVDGIDFPSGTVQFRDPWLIDYNDPTYGNTPRNRGMADAIFKSVASANGNLGTSSVYKGVFKNLDPNQPNVLNYYKIKANASEVFGGIDVSFQNWSTSGATIPNWTSIAEQPVIFTSDNAVVTANYKAMLASKNTGWVQSPFPYSGNGKSTIAYFSPDPSTDTGFWIHQENGTSKWEVNILADGWSDLTNSPPVSYSVVDYNKQKSYLGYIALEPENNIVSIREVINGVQTGFNYTFSSEDPIINNLTANAKIYLSPAVAVFGGSYPATYGHFIVTIIDGSSIYTKYATMSGDVVSSWSSWSTMTNSYNPRFVTNGKVPFLVWLENGSLKCRRYKPGTLWNSIFTPYSTGYYDFAASVNSTDDLVLMMKRIDSGGPKLCTGKLYANNSTMPLTILETTTTGNYQTNSLATENGKLLAVVGKQTSGGQPYYYNLWKYNGTWKKELTTTSSPKKLLHNEVDFTVYEEVIPSIPSLNILKTTAVDWGAVIEKEGDENGLSIVAAVPNDTLNWYTTVSPHSVDSMIVDTTGLWHIVMNDGSDKEIMISGLNRFGSAFWVDSSKTVQFKPASARYEFWVVDPTGSKIRYGKQSSGFSETEFTQKDEVNVFPNPFNPTTVFSVRISQQSHVKLTVYNSIGQQVAKIIDGELHAGVHDFNFNGGFLSSGTYFYRLETNDVVKTGKLQLIK